MIDKAWSILRGVRMLNDSTLKIAKKLLCPNTSENDHWQLPNKTLKPY